MAAGCSDSELWCVVGLNGDSGLVSMVSGCYCMGVELCGMGSRYGCGCGLSSEEWSCFGVLKEQ